MLNKLLRKIVILTVGKPAEDIVELLNSSKYVNEFAIAKKLGITINQARNILYKLSNYGLVSSVRKKDKKKGWYTYSWKFEISKCLEFLKNILIKRKNEIEKEINSRNSQIFYVCKSCGLEHGENEALLMNFTCDECGEIFTTKESSRIIKNLKRELSKIEEKLSFVEIEIENEQTKLSKKRNLEIKREEKEKENKKLEAKIKRELKRKENKRLKEKENKKLNKKVNKKKASKKITKKNLNKKSKVISKKKKIISKKKKIVKKKVVKKNISKKKKIPKKIIKKINKRSNPKKKTSSKKKKVVKKNISKKKKHKK